MRHQDVRLFEGLMDVPPTILSQVGGPLDARRLFFVHAEQHVESTFRLLSHYVLYREALRTQTHAALLAEALRATGARYFKRFTVTDLLETMERLRLCNAQAAHDRGSFRMRYVAAAVVCLLHSVRPELELTGVLLTKAAAFGVLTGGLGLCRLLRARLSEITLPAWCKALLERHDCAMALWLRGARHCESQPSRCVF